MQLCDLTCEFLKNPLGIDSKIPRLSWKIRADVPNFLQSAYQIQCAARIEDLGQESLIFWDSGRIKSDHSQLVVYGGPVLHSYQRIFWRVKIWDQNEIASEWSQPAWWEMGILHPEEWVAKWIDPEPPTLNTKLPQPASYLRFEFKLIKPIIQAKMYITSHGIYRAFLNQKTVTDQLFTPGRTEYEKRLQYQVYDVTSLLTTQNAWGVILAEGWYRGSVGVGNNRNVFGNRITLLAQIRVEYADGTIATITTNHDWKATQQGPLRITELKQGEIYDSRMDLGGWDKVGYDATAWQQVT